MFRQQDFKKPVTREEKRERKKKSQKNIIRTCVVRAKSQNRCRKQHEVNQKQKQKKKKEEKKLKKRDGRGNKHPSKRGNIICTKVDYGHRHTLFNKKKK